MIIFALGLMTFLSSFGQSAHPPGIRFSATTNDFGRVIAGTLLQHDFIFTNTGGATLLVTNVKANCGCTIAGAWTREVKPGGTGKIPLAYQTPKLDWLSVKEATVFCNDPQQPAVRLELRATLWRPVSADPELVILTVTNRVLTDEVGVVRIVNQEAAPLVLSAPVGDNRLFAAELKTIVPGREFELRVRTVPPLDAGKLSGHFTLKTSTTNQPELQVGAYLQLLSSPSAPKPAKTLEMLPDLFSPTIVPAP